MNKKIKQLNAFTLAEVLITLGVIGVVAAMTMPTLIQNYKKKETVTRLKRAYSEIQQVIRMSEAEHGEISSWGVPSTATAAEVHDYLEEYIVKYFKPLKKCVPVTEECVKNPKYLNGIVLDYGEKYIYLISNNGFSYLVWLHNSGNGGWIFVDVNGPNQGENTVGKDIFAFIMQFDNNFAVNADPNNVVVEKTGVFPVGFGLKRPLSRDELISVDTEYTELNRYKCSKSGTGRLCGALIITDGWEIKDDYPW